jgi:hypothetical protein
VKQTFDVFLMYETDAYPKPRFVVHAYDMSTVSGYVLVNKQAITADIPEDFNVMAAQVSALKSEREKVANEFRSKLMYIDDQIGKLLCLTNEVTA